MICHGRLWANRPAVPVMPKLILPDSTHLDSYADALGRGWSPNNLRPEAAEEELRRVQTAPAEVLQTMEDTEAVGPLVKLPDGREVDRLPGIRRFIWDGEFCGVCSLRWPRDGGELPEHVTGHIGYAVVPWKQGMGYATIALGELVALAPGYGLKFVDISTTPDNIASRKVITANGGRPLREYVMPVYYGGGSAIMYRIDL